MKTLRNIGSKNVSDVIVIRNKADNSPLLGVVYSDITAYYHKIGFAPVELPLVAQTVTGVHKDGGFVEIDSSSVPGHYRIDLPDEMFLAESNSVFFQIKGHADMYPVDVEIQLGSAVLTEVGVSIIKESVPAGPRGAGYYRG